MRLIKALFGLAFVVMGVLFGALNRQVVAIDFGFYTLSTSLGFGLLCVLLVGALVGGLVAMAGAVWPRRRRELAGTSVADPAADAARSDE